MKVKCFVIGMCLCCVMLLGATWSTPQRLVPYNTGSNIPCIIVDNEGIAWSVFRPWVVNYPNDDTGWQLVSDDCHPGGSSNGNFACFDKSDTLWVFNGNFDQIYYVRFYDGNWSEVDTLPAYPGGNSPADVAVDSSGGVWACWLWWWEVVACSRYKDGQWEEPQLIPDTVPGQDWNVTIATDALGRVWLGWYTRGEERNSLECMYSEGGVWSKQMLIRGIDPLHLIGIMDFAPDRDGGIWAVWYVFVSNKDSCFVEARHYKDGVWGDIDTVANAGIFLDYGYHPMPKVAVDAYGRAWAVWRQALVPKDSICDIYYSYNSGRGWSEPKPVDTDPAVDHLPDIAVDGAGRVWCVWSSNRDDSTGVWASYATGAGIEEPVTPVTPVTHATRPGLSVEPGIGREFTFRISNPGYSQEVIIYDACGRAVRSLEINDAGVVFWDGTDSYGCKLSSRVYFASLKGAPGIRKVVLIR